MPYRRRVRYTMNRERLEEPDCCVSQHYDNEMI